MDHQVLVRRFSLAFVAAMGPGCDGGSKPDGGTAAQAEAGEGPSGTSGVVKGTTGPAAETTGEAGAVVKHDPDLKLEPPSGPTGVCFSTTCEDPEAAPIEMGYPPPYDRCRVDPQFSAKATDSRRKPDEGNQPHSCCYTTWESCGNRMGGRPLRVDTVPSLPSFRCEAVSLSREARHWIEQARTEHASVAAFAATAIVLLRLGAPASLIRACHEAAADEARHAELCIGLARRHGAGAVLLGPMRVDADLQASATDLALETIIDGCVGETIAAESARANALNTPCPSTRLVLREIATDELRHAELAYAIVGWLWSRVDQARVQALLDGGTLELSGAARVARAVLLGSVHADA